MTIGVFDGVHRGHQALIEKVVGRAPQAVPTVVTFRQYPKQVLRPGEYQGDIVTLDRKMIIFESLGVELVILIDFSREFSKLDGRDFIGRLKSRGGMRFLVVGGNFRCGCGLDTGAAEIKALFPPAEVIPPIMEGGLPVSSSRIRGAVSGGGLETAALLLGRRVEIDLAGLSPCPGPGGIFYETRSHYRLLPPPGRYRFLENGGTEAEVLITGEGIVVPPENQADRIELLRPGGPGGWPPGGGVAGAGPLQRG
jgi:riboflavin kinase/FMN adenylyltransferase